MKEDQRKENGQPAAVTAELANIEFSIPTTEKKIDDAQRSNHAAVEQAQVDIPVGGSTGLSHTDLGRVELAARFVATTPCAALSRPLTVTLQQMFGLTSTEAEEAIAEARLIRARAT